MYHGRLPTNLYLHRFGVNISKECSFCNANQEDINHIFFKCPNALHFWSGISNGIPMLSSNVVTSNNWLSCWKSMANQAFNTYISWYELIPHCLWNIWLTRNDNHFNQKKNMISTETSIHMAMEYKLLFSSKNEGATKRQPISVKWEPPPRGVYMLNIIGSADPQPGHGVLGDILRNHEGVWELGFIEHLPTLCHFSLSFLLLEKALSWLKNIT